jgi:hypothetical protein
MRLSSSTRTPFPSLKSGQESLARPPDRSSPNDVRQLTRSSTIPTKDASPCAPRAAIAHRANALCSRGAAAARHRRFLQRCAFRRTFPLRQNLALTLGKRRWARRVSNLRPLACEAGREGSKKAQETALESETHQRPLHGDSGGVCGVCGGFSPPNARGGLNSKKTYVRPTYVLERDTHLGALGDVRTTVRTDGLRPPRRWPRAAPDRTI